MAELGARTTQIVRRHPLGSAALFLLVIGIAFQLFWLVVVVVTGAGTIAWFRFDQRRQLETWIEDEGLGPDALQRHTARHTWREELVRELSFEPFAALLVPKHPPRGSEPTAHYSAPPARRPLSHASNQTGEMNGPRAHELELDADARPVSGGGRRVPSHWFENAAAQRQSKEPNRLGERASGPARSRDEVRAKLERPVSGLRDAGRTRRGLVFHS